ncbi:hypothetical protein MPH_06237 [Macrophomina phaseolina MS6]|uniref:Six-bladed beta-propeller TolB-like protein n=1 Tax=Macrophomina phaseolina (strain MS6) TaxID=1126212 RepID=K2R2H4_MACPH|nr:hypothetical protein MPH_06237 [Macrophomina phaseolina MS6]
MTSPSSSQRLYILDCDLTHWSNRSGRILTCRPDGSDLQTLIKDLQELPDGIAIDHTNAHIYWTNMGTSGFAAPDGSIQRSNLDGTNLTTILPPSSTHTPKQLAIAPRSGKLYWSDREGMRVMRANLDGSDLETLVSTGTTPEHRADKTRWCVGIAVDEARGWFYWTQKGPSKGNAGRILRARIDGGGAPARDPAERGDVECLFEGLPEPIDLELDEERQVLYWTDRGDPPTGNTLNRAFVGEGRRDGERQILARRLHETIGLALDARAQVVYVTDLAGGVYRVKVGGEGEGEKDVLFSELGDLTGIALSG